MDARLWCPSCNAVRKPSEVDFDSIPVRCGVCGTAIEVDDGQMEAKKQPGRRPIAVPENYWVESDDYYLRLSYRPREFLGIDITLIAMLVFLCASLGIFLALPLDLDVPAVKGVMVFLLPGMAVLFGKLAGRLIRTNIIVGGGHLQIRSNLLPWIGGKSISVDRIRQLYAKGGRRTTGRKTKLAVYQTYQLWTIVHGGRHIQLLDGLGTLHEAAYLEQTIEEHLGIANCPVEGSIPW
jgi:hypothetical protein